MRRAILLLLLTMPAMRALADAGDVGTTAANFLKIPPDARPAAMGEAATAISDDESALVYNPAGMAGSLQDMFSATHIEWFQGIHLEHLGGFAQLGPMGTLGAALTWLQVDSMPRTVRTGANSSDPINNFAEIGSFSPHDMELSFAYALPFNANNSWGARLNIIQQNIDTSNGYGVGLDLGWRTTNIWDALDLGLTLRNLGSQISVGGTPADQPLELATGARYSFFSHRASLVGECLIPADNSIEGSVGGEFWMAGLVALRAGYKMGYLNQYTAGAGVKVADLVIDYAWVPYGDLGNTQRITASLAFGSPTIGLSASRPLIGPLGWPAWRSMDWLPQAPSLERMNAWRLYIRDGAGNEFLASQGAGPVPSHLPWNGRDAKGLALPDGKAEARWEADYAGGLHAKSLCQRGAGFHPSPAGAGCGAQSAAPQQGRRGAHPGQLHGPGLGPARHRRMEAADQGREGPGLQELAGLWRPAARGGVGRQRLQGRLGRDRQGVCHHPHRLRQAGQLRGERAQLAGGADARDPPHPGQRHAL